MIALSLVAAVVAGFAVARSWGAAVVLGLGLSGAAFAAQLLVLGWTGASSDLALLLAGALALWLRPRAGRRACPANAGWLVALVVLAALVVGALFVEHSIRYPDGGWDARAIWNLQARGLFSAPHDLRMVYSDAAPHGDYPPLLPALIAHGWFEIGHWSQVVPIAVAALFAAGGALALFRAAGPPAVLLLLGTPLFLTLAWNQYADLKLAMLLLVAVLLAGDGCHAAAGLAAGLAALTKNEGLLEAGALAAAVGLAAGPRALSRYCAGACLPLGLLLWFKARLAPQNDLWRMFSLRRALSSLPFRVPLVLAGFLRQLVAFETWGLAAAAVALAWVLRFHARPRGSVALWFLAFSLAIVFCIYLFTPQEPAAHLRSSADRLLFQLWPAMIYATSRLWPEAAQPAAGAK